MCVIIMRSPVIMRRSSFSERRSLGIASQRKSLAFFSCAIDGSFPRPQAGDLGTLYATTCQRCQRPGLCAAPARERGRQNPAGIDVSEHLRKIPRVVRPILQAARRMVKAIAPKAKEIAFRSQPPRRLLELRQPRPDVEPGWPESGPRTPSRI